MRSRMKKLLDNLRDSERAQFTLVFCIITTVLAIEVVYYTLFLNTWFDEANFAYKSWLSGNGLALPFIDFTNKYPSFIFYLEALLQKLWGPTILGARILSAAFLAGSLVLLYRIGKQIGGKFIGVLALAFLAANPYLVGYYTSATPYAATVFFLLLGFWLLEKDNLNIRSRVFLASGAMMLGALVRYNVIPVMILLWLYIGLRWRKWNYVWLSVGTTAGLLLIAFLPYAYIDGYGALVWFVAMFGPLVPTTFKLPSAEGPHSLFSLLGANYIASFTPFFIKFFPILAIVGGGCLAWILSGAQAMRESISRHRATAFATAIFLTLFAAHFIVPTDQWSLLHSLYFLPFGIIAAAGLISIVVEKLKSVDAWRFVRIPVVSFIIATLLASSVSLALSGPDIIFFNHWDLGESDLARVARGGAYLASLTKPEDILMSFDSPHDVFMAGRVQIPQTINGEFTYLRDTPAEDLKPFAYFNHGMFIDWLENYADVVVFQKAFLPETILGNGADLKQFETILASKYQLVGSIENVYPRKYTRGDGVMEVYRRK